MTTGTSTAASSLRIRPADHAWEQFPDPHGRPTTPVRILRHDDPYVLEADFPPGFYAGLHWHPHDTLYVITAGELQFVQHTMSALGGFSGSPKFPRPSAITLLDDLEATIGRFPNLKKLTKLGAHQYRWDLRTMGVRIAKIAHDLSYAATYEIDSKAGAIRTLSWPEEEGAAHLLLAAGVAGPTASSKVIQP